ncbi:MAG TPA: type II secretion system protein [Thermoanaerobaculia bacterium]|nr:type II secretion system protein [Thermoanaerobaculia bacterium]
MIAARLGRNRRSAGQRGYTITEMVVVCAVLSTLAAVTLPVAKYTTTRVREAELRSALRSMRNAIDEYKRYSDAGLIPIELGTEGYPAELEDLVEPIEIVGQIDKQIRFLRRVPIDPMTGEADWGKRSTSDEPDATSWGGGNVFDVYSQSGRRGLNGVPYSEW